MGKKETKIQSQILDWLNNNGFHSVRVVVASKAGVSDILACSPRGRFIAIEVKQGSNTTSDLQDDFIEEIKHRKGIAFAAWDLQTVIHKLQGEIDVNFKKREAQANSPVFL